MGRRCRDLGLLQTAQYVRLAATFAYVLVRRQQVRAAPTVQASLQGKTYETAKCADTSVDCSGHSQAACSHHHGLPYRFT